MTTPTAHDSVHAPRCCPTRPRVPQPFTVTHKTAGHALTQAFTPFTPQPFTLSPPSRRGRNVNGEHRHATSTKDPS